MERIKFLVLDSTAFIDDSNLENLAEEYLTVREVLNEVKDNKTRRRIKNFPFQIKILDPTEESYNTILNATKATGDYASLSLVDLRLLSLAYEVTRERWPELEIITTPQKVTLMGGMRPTGESESEKEPAEIEENENGEDDEESEEDGEVEGEEDEDDDDGWITPQNLKSHLKQEAVIVALATNDFAMQNVLLAMGLKYKATKQIRSSREYILRCHACFNTESDLTRVFCRHCGNRTMTKVTVSRENGELRLHLSTKFSHNLRGKKFSLPNPKGGKHGQNPHLVADQKFPQERMAKKSAGELFARDVNSKSAQVKFGKGRNYWERRNPNESRPQH